MADLQKWIKAEIKRERPKEQVKQYLNISGYPDSVHHLVDALYERAAQAKFNRILLTIVTAAVLAMIGMASYLVYDWYDQPQDVSDFLIQYSRTEIYGGTLEEFGTLEVGGKYFTISTGGKRLRLTSNAPVSPPIFVKDKPELGVIDVSQLSQGDYVVITASVDQGGYRNVQRVIVTK